VTVAASGALKGEAEAVESGGIASKPLAMVDEALRLAGLEREQIEYLAVGIGPGSYTGIRTSIALAQGWQLARSVKLLGISSSEAIAAEAHAQGVTGEVGVVIDAQRGEFYLAVYEIGPSSWREAQPLRLASVAEIRAHCKEGAQPIGPEVTTIFPQGRLVFPRAAVLGRLATGRTDFIAGESLEPIYLRQTTFVKAAPGSSLLETKATRKQR